MQGKDIKAVKQIIVNELTIKFYQHKRGYSWVAEDCLTKVDFSSKIYSTYYLAEEAALFYTLRHQYNHIENPTALVDAKTWRLCWNNIASQEKFQLDLTQQKEVKAIDFFQDKQEAVDFYRDAIQQGKKQQLLKMQSPEGDFEMLAEDEVQMVGNKLIIVCKSIKMY